MDISSATIVTLLEVGKFVSDTVILYQKGELTQEELDARVESMQITLRSSLDDLEDALEDIEEE